MLFQQPRKSASQVQQQTPSNHTIKMISEKWRRIAFEMDQQKSLRHQQLQDKMKQLEKQALTVKNDEMKQLSDSINTLNLSVQDYLKDEYDGKSKKTYENTQKNLEKSFNFQSQQTDESQKRVEQLLDWSSLQDQLSRNESQFDFSLQNKLLQISDSVQQIESVLENEKEHRAQSFENIEYQLQQKLATLKGHIIQESNIRRQKENKVFDMINDVHQHLSLMLLDEKKQRQIMTDNLMQLMDDACIRIDRNLSSF